MPTLCTQLGKFASYARVPPMDRLRLNPHAYMTLVGIAELVCVGLLVFGRSRVGLLSNWVLLVIMLGALYTHYSVGDTLQDMGGALAGLTFVLTRLYTLGALNTDEITMKLR